MKIKINIGDDFMFKKEYAVMQLNPLAIFVLCGMLILGSLMGFALVNASDIKVLMDDKALSFDVPPQIIEGRTLVPFRAVFEAYGGVVEWDGEQQTVIATVGNKTIVLRIDTLNAKVNDKEVPLDVPAMLINSRTMVPLRFISENLGSEVKWEGNENTVIITTNKNKTEGQNAGYGGDVEPMRFLDGEFAGQYNPADIRGNYTFAKTSQYFNIPLDILAKAFGIPLDVTATFQNKHLHNAYPELMRSGKEMGNGEVAFFVALYKGLPYTIHEPRHLLESAVEILKELGSLNEDQIAYLDEHTITLEEAGEFNQDFSENSHEKDEEIAGQTTFADILRMGVTAEQISKIFNDDTWEDSVKIKDFCVIKDLQFSEIKKQLYEEIYSNQ